MNLMKKNAMPLHSSLLHSRGELKWDVTEACE